MPNNITNELNFKECTAERCREILEAIKMDDVGVGSIDFDKIIPQPEGLYMGDLGKKEWELYKDNNWYDWRYKNWGTKWNSYGYTCGAVYNEDDNQIRFETANGSARKIIAALSRQYPDVLFELRYADEDFGYNVGEITFCGGEDIDGRIPQGGTFEAQELAADIMGYALEFDVETGNGFTLALNAHHYDYTEGAHVSAPFQCDISFGHPVVLCYDKDNGKAWLEIICSENENVELLEKVENSIRAWGIHPCESWDDYNSYVQCLGDDAMETAYYDEEGMTMC